jgi:hypothetical protein
VQHGACLVPRHRFEHRIKVALPCRIVQVNLQVHRAPRIDHTPDLQLGRGAFARHEKRDCGHPRRELAEDLQTFWSEFRRKHGNARRGASRPVKTCDQPIRNRITPGQKHQRNCSADFPMSRESRVGVGRDDDGNVATQEAGRKGGQAIVRTLRPSELDSDILTRAVTRFIETLAKRINQLRFGDFRSAAEVADPASLLRACRERTGHRAAQQPNEFPPPPMHHSGRPLPSIRLPQPPAKSLWRLNSVSTGFGERRHHAQNPAFLDFDLAPSHRVEVGRCSKQRIQGVLGIMACEMPCDGLDLHGVPNLIIASLVQPHKGRVDFGEDDPRSIFA